MCSVNGCNGRGDFLLTALNISTHDRWADYISELYTQSYLRICLKALNKNFSGFAYLKPFNIWNIITKSTFCGHASTYIYCICYFSRQRVLSDYQNVWNSLSFENLVLYIGGEEGGTNYRRYVRLRIQKCKKCELSKKF